MPSNAVGNAVVSSTDSLTIGTTNFVPQVVEGLIKADDRSRPIFSIMSKMGMIEDAWNFQYQWQEIQFDEPSVNCETAVNSGVAGSTFDANLDSLAVRPGDQFLDAPTNQLFEVVQIYSQDGATVGGHTAPVGGVAAQFKKQPATSAISATTANSMWIRMPNPHLEGGGYADPITKLPQRRSNTLAQFNDSVSASELSEYLKTYYGSPFATDLERAQRQMAHDLERATIFGKQYDQIGAIARNNLASDTGRQTGTQGVWDGIQSKRVLYNNAVTETGLDSFLATLFGDVYGGGDSKYCFAGPQVYADIAGFIKNKFREVNQTGLIKYGVAIQEYVSPVGAGSAMFIEERQFFDPKPGGNTPSLNPYRGTILALDPAYFRLMKVGPSISRVKNTTPLNLDRKSLAIITWMGVKLMMERFHGIYSSILN